MVKIIQEKQVIVYQTAAGKEPYTNWIKGLRDTKTRRRIINRVFRIQSGNYGDLKP